GYVVMEEGQEEAAEELRGRLRKRLPEWMVPGVVVRLKELPLTANGKVNKKALPDPQPHDRSADQYEPPRTPVEEAVAGIFKQVLAAERVGVNDDFFEIGGHSLLATRTMARVRESLQVELPLRSIFESPTVAALAQVIEQARESRPELQMPSIKAIPRKAQLITISS